MTPDVVAALGPNADRPERLKVLDAKYRIDDGLNEALSSIHTYRDAARAGSANGKDRRNCISGVSAESRYAHFACILSRDVIARAAVSSRNTAVLSVSGH